MSATVNLLKGLKRLPKEHFSVYVGRKDQQLYLKVGSGRWSYFADPFIWRCGEQLWLLVEEFEYLKDRGRLCAIPLDESLKPGSPVPMLALEYHASFPFVFEYDDRLYLVPETSRANCVDLYICEKFPRDWRRMARLIDDIDAADTVIFQHANRWWLITSVRRDSKLAARCLAIYFCDDFRAGHWRAHPVNESRKFGGTRYSTGRNAGAIVCQNGHLLRLAQDNRDYYGQSVCAMQIDELTPTVFKETPCKSNHLLAGITRRFSPHHVSVNGEFVAFDVRDRFSYSQYLPYWGSKARARLRSG